MSLAIPIAFFAYPSQPPSLPETIRSAIERINAARLVHIKSWEDGRIGGKFIISEICASIAAADLLLADLTGLNPNVLFEVGFAIAKSKRVWPILDTSVAGSEFNDFRTLTSVGYASYTNARDIEAAYLKDQPQADLKSSLLESIIQSPNRSPSGGGPVLLYLKSQHDTEASVQVSTRLESSYARVILDDPRESPSQTLSWYGQQVSTAHSVVCHLTNPARHGARVRNARYALVAGMAFGMAKELLIICEGDFLAPLDYRDMTRTYTTAAAAVRHLSSWLSGVEKAWRDRAQAKPVDSATQRLATELKGLYLGEHIAENEGEALVDGYFVETKAYADAVAGTHTIFVGRKGTGKSANFLQLAAYLKADIRNVLSVIKPVAYELEGVLRVLGELDRDKKTFVLEGLWKFLLYSEIAGALYAKIEAKVLQARTDIEQEFLKFCVTNKLTLSGDFSSRLERCIGALESGPARHAAGIEEYRHAIAETLHSEVIKELRRQLVQAMPRGARVAVIVDNLDKAWDRQSDLRALAEFLLGLLSAAAKIRQELKNELPSSVTSLAVFLRADIFDKVQEVAREPDKIQFTRLSWKDKELLYKLLDERFAAAEGEGIAPGEIWTRFFCNKVKGQSPKEFLVNSILPRPRDFIFVTNAAISTAVNRGHAYVEESDLIEARKAYSEFAIEILIIEDNSEEGLLEKVLYEFAGATACVTIEDVRSRIEKATGAPPLELDKFVSQLCALSFLGIEVGDNDFRFPESGNELKKVAVLSRKLCEHRNSDPRFLIHPAFRPFLEISDDIQMWK